MEKNLSLYFHIPFCEKKCNYCDFASFANCDQDIDQYLNLLEKEIMIKKNIFNHIKASTIYIGGGTPSCLSARQLEKLLKIIHRQIDISQTENQDIEFTVEANPNSLDKEKLNLMKKSGVNRISLGAQSFNDKELKLLGRQHNVEDILFSIDLINKVGIENYNIDLMYGIPGQTRSSWQETINKIKSISPPHISTYNLIVEENTLFYSLERANKLNLPYEDDVISMYDFAVSTLKEVGYSHYEISNFCRPSYSSKHNLTYWDNEYYLGFGLGAWSYIINYRFSNQELIKNYFEQYAMSLQDKHELSLSDLLSVQAEVEEYKLLDEIENHIMLGLRKIEGIDIKNFKQRYGKDFDLIYSKQIKKLVDNNLLISTEKGYSLSYRGILLSNNVINEFLG